MTLFLKTAPFLGAKDGGQRSRLALFGCPYDGTSSYRAGARFGPPAIREASQVLETYDPRLKCDLDDVSFCDLGDIELSPGDKADALAKIAEAAKEVLAAGQIPAALGGEHLITLPVVQTVFDKFPDMCLVQFDAHLDLRDKYLEDKLSHATVTRRVADFLHPSRILLGGARSGTLEEFQLAREFQMIEADSPRNQVRDWVGARPVYVTVDLDVLDPGCFPAAGTPEPGGISYCQLENWLCELKESRIVGWDVVELAPHWDPSNVSSIVAAKVVRSLICLSVIC
ncbi:MAG: agmatinase [bacterium]